LAARAIPSSDVVVSEVGLGQFAESLSSVAEASREAAASAGLRYVSSETLGIVRRRSGKGFAYQDRDGATVTDLATRERIYRLAIPPAWTEVRIAERPNAHLQAVGFDQRGRLQYRYHPGFREVRDAAKFDHLIAFAEGLSALREQVRRDMARPGLGRERVLATVVRLLETTMIRVGGAAYAEANKSYGLASLRSRHVEVHGGDLKFHFMGKSGKVWSVGVKDRRVARIVRACQELPGQALFQYLDVEGARQAISSTDVNAYLKAASGAEISAKDFRTWWGTVLAAMALHAEPPAAGETDAKRKLKSVIATVSSVLGNTPAVCLKCYVHPKIVSAYLAGELSLRRPPHAVSDADGLAPEERMVLNFLKRRA